FHDLHETLGRQHFLSHPSITEAELESAQITRLGDILASEDEYREAGEWVSGFCNQLDQTRPYSTREFLHLVGRELSEIASEDGVLTSAYKARVPIFCPNIADSAVAIGIAASRFEKKNVNFQFDLIQDVLDATQIAARARVSGVINIGGGSAKTFIQQTDVATDVIKAPSRGHKYAIQISTEAAQPSERPNSTGNDETTLFGKLARGAHLAYVNCDATIALPILITALSQTGAKYMKGRKRPNFTFATRDLGIEVP
ncbi:MAG TPA: deoxyhypusine synthase family protein, partial [Pyrinomonadaceae bacterium]|nr:deoxyhypusine synthase family protein [Pyrinomonadaceae bacterium]